MHKIVKMDEAIQQLQQYDTMKTWFTLTVVRKVMCVKGPERKMNYYEQYSQFFCVFL